MMALTCSKREEEAVEGLFVEDLAVRTQQHDTFCSILWPLISCNAWSSTSRCYLVL